MLKCDVGRRNKLRAFWLCLVAKYYKTFSMQLYRTGFSNKNLSQYCDNLRQSELTGLPKMTFFYTEMHRKVLRIKFPCHTCNNGWIWFGVLLDNWIYYGGRVATNRGRPSRNLDSQTGPQPRRQCKQVINWCKTSALIGAWKCYSPPF